MKAGKSTSLLLHFIFDQPKVSTGELSLKSASHRSAPDATEKTDEPSNTFTVFLS